MGRAGEGWVPACARTTVEPCASPTGRLLGPRMREDNGGGGDDGGGMGSPSPSSRGAGSASGIMGGKERFHCGTAPTGDTSGCMGRFANRAVRVVNNEGFSSMGAIYFHSNHGGGRPRGTPLRGLGSVGGEGDGGGMGPRMREDNASSSFLIKTG